MRADESSIPATNDSVLERVARCLREVCVSPKLRGAVARANSVVAGCLKNRDSNPSLHIYPVLFANGTDAWVYRCHSCGETGSLAELIARDTGMPTHKARAIIREYIGTGTQVCSIAPSRQRSDNTQTLLNLTAGYCFEVGWQDSRAYTGLMRRQRSHLELRVSRRQIRRLGLGVGPYVKTYTAALAERLPQPTSQAMLDEAEGVFRRLSGRIVIPVRGMDGHVACLYGRAIDGDAQNRYIAVGSLGGALYGLDVAADAIARAGCAIVVEGPFDACSIYELSAQCRDRAFDNDREMIGPLDHTVACMGARPSLAQLETLRQHTDTVVLIRDGDKADDLDGTLAFIRDATGLGLHASVSVVPNGMDPDEYLASLRETGMQPMEMLQAFVDNALRPANDWTQRVVTDIVEKHPECCPELWKELHRIARATCRPDDVVSAASAALGMPASEFGEQYEVATHKLELEELYEAFRHSDELAYFVLDRDELSRVVARCSRAELLVWLVLKAEQMRVKGADGVFSVVGHSIALNAGLCWRSVRSALEGLSEKALIQVGMMKEWCPFEVGVPPLYTMNYIKVPYDFVWKGHAARAGTALPVLLVLKACTTPVYPGARVRVETIAQRAGRNRSQVGKDIKKLVSLGHVYEYRAGRALQRLVRLVPEDSEESDKGMAV